MYPITLGAIKDTATGVLGERDGWRTTTCRHLTARSFPAAAAFWRLAAARIPRATAWQFAATRSSPAAAGMRQLTAGNFWVAAAKAVTVAVAAA